MSTPNLEGKAIQKPWKNKLYNGGMHRMKALELSENTPTECPTRKCCKWKSPNEWLDNSCSMQDQRPETNRSGRCPPPPPPKPWSDATERKREDLVEERQKRCLPADAGCRTTTCGQNRSPDISTTRLTRRGSPIDLSTLVEGISCADKSPVQDNKGRTGDPEDTTLCSHKRNSVIAWEELSPASERKRPSNKDSQKQIPRDERRVSPVWPVKSHRSE